MNPVPSLTGAGPRSRVLVVDDIPKNLQVIGTMLRNAGCAVMPATSGPRPWKAFKRKRPTSCCWTS
jgi:CheY-like chemotaxis protein